jgi:hypothetical protein
MLGQKLSWAADVRGVTSAWRKRQGGTGGLLRMGLAQKDRQVLFFFKIIFIAKKTIPKILEIVLKARKILKKSQTFQENSQRLIGT